jgi:hypothetical protein
MMWLLLSLAFFLFSSQSHGETFQEVVNNLDSSNLKFHIRVLEARMGYLENEVEVQNNYVMGIPPSTDHRAIEKAILLLEKKNSAFKKEVSPVIDQFEKRSSCRVFFETDLKALQKLIELARVIAKNPLLGSQSPVGYFWNGVQQSDREDSPASREIIRSTIQFELLSRAFLFQNAYFQEDMEGSGGLLNSEKFPCTCQGRDSLKQRNGERLIVLENLYHMLLGKRGVWDVLPLSNLIGRYAQAELKTMRNETIKSIAIGTGIFFAWHLAAPAVTSVVSSVGPGLALWTGRGLSVLNYGLLGYLGYQLYPELSKAINSSTSEHFFDSSAASSAVPSTVRFLDIPTSDFALAKLTTEYETTLHTFTVKQSPQKLASVWYSQELKKFRGNKQKLQEDYIKKLHVLRSELARKNEFDSYQCNELRN